ADREIVGGSPPGIDSGDLLVAEVTLRRGIGPVVAAHGADVIDRCHRSGVAARTVPRVTDANANCVCSPSVACPRNVTRGSDHEPSLRSRRTHATRKFAMDGPSTPYPASVCARLDDPARWSWLYKWILVIPHLIVLGFLWIAFAILSVIAWFSIVV